MQRCRRCLTARWHSIRNIETEIDNKWITLAGSNKQNGRKVAKSVQLNGLELTQQRRSNGCASAKNQEMFKREGTVWKGGKAMATITNLRVKAKTWRDGYHWQKGDENEVYRDGDGLHWQAFGKWKWRGEQARTRHSTKWCNQDEVVMSSNDTQSKGTFGTFADGYRCSKDNFIFCPIKCKLDNPVEIQMWKHNLTNWQLPTNLLLFKSFE